jgi:uncharacterized protein (DUF433 family)
VADGVRVGDVRFEGEWRLTFPQLAELFVRGFAVQAVTEWGREETLTGERWRRLREVGWRPFHQLALVPVFAGTETVEARVHRLLAAVTQPLESVEEAWLAKWLRLRLDRVELHDGQPVRIYPFSRDPAEDSPRAILLDPSIRFGRPTVAGVPTDVLFERHQAGDSVAELAADYGLTAGQVEEALRYEAAPVACPCLGR